MFFIVRTALRVAGHNSPGFSRFSSLLLLIHLKGGIATFQWSIHYKLIHPVKFFTYRLAPTFEFCWADYF